MGRHAKEIPSGTTSHDMVNIIKSILTRRLKNDVEHDLSRNGRVSDRTRAVRDWLEKEKLLEGSEKLW